MCMCIGYVTVAIYLIYPIPQVEAVKSTKHIIYMIFEYLEYDLTGLLDNKVGIISLLEVLYPSSLSDWTLSIITT